MQRVGAFRFTYFTEKYQQTCAFYRDDLGFNLEHSWDRSDHDKGSLFKSGAGLIEVLLHPDDQKHQHAGLDYRPPQGAFMCLQVWDIDNLFEQYQSKGLPFKQQLTDQTWGHRSFSLVEPNGLILFFFQEQF
jgi:catechol 2,3-dioxygenase-like lactoylglutathione lyase family enzyme